MSCMPDMTLTSLVATVRLVREKSLKMASEFLKEEKICYKIAYYSLCLNRVGKLEFKQTKNQLFWGAWHLKG